MIGAGTMLRRWRKTREAYPVPAEGPAGLAYASDDDTVLLQFDGEPWRLRDAYEGVQAFGATGSGKSSSSGLQLAQAYLRAGMGGLVLCAKPGEAETWRHYCELAGRQHHLIEIDGRNGLRFNFLRYELSRGGEGSGEIFNLVALFLRMVEAASRHGGIRSGGGGSDPFWERATAELLTHAFEVLYTAIGDVSLADLLDLIYSAPTSPDQVRSKEWREESFCCRVIRRALEAPVLSTSPHDLRVSADYWMKKWPSDDPRTRGNIAATLTSMITPFLKGSARELLCTGIDVVPELTHEGAILVVNLPVKQWDSVGVLTQQIVKYVWQRATERRSVGPQTRPVFLWADECQFFVNSYDAEFQSTARSSRACTVYITQNIASYYSMIGGARPEHAADALLGNFQTKIFHQNGDRATNQLAADMIGRGVHWRRSHGQSENSNYSRTDGENDGWSVSMNSRTGDVTRGHSGGYSTSRTVGGGNGTNAGVQEAVDYLVEPNTFSALKKGGPHGYAEAIVFQGGKRWSRTGAPYVRLRFPQGVA